MDEQWCGNPSNPDAVPQRSEIEWAREFRYDGARARYLNRPLQPAPLENTTPSVQDLSPVGQFVEAIYDGDQPYADRVGSLWQRLFVPGVGKVEPFSQVSPPNGGDNTEYYHADHLGTMRTMTDPAGAGIDHNGGYSGVDTVYTAFGEPVVNTLADGDANRYGYVGAHGYQAHDTTTHDVPMPYLHVGARYYDPASGRFLQRDPIGINGGLNVYCYVNGLPIIRIDPSGKDWVDDINNTVNDWVEDVRPAINEAVEATVQVIYVDTHQAAANILSGGYAPDFSQDLVHTMSPYAHQISVRSNEIALELAGGKALSKLIREGIAGARAASRYLRDLVLYCGG